ncbi:Ig-like domain-containing protein, partial [Colwelliaceae bacterium MEBiC 14330]
IDGEISLSDDGKRVQFSPEGGLTAGHQYRALISYSPYMLDLAGNRINSINFYFTAGQASDEVSPEVVANSFSANTAGVAINAPIKLVFNEALAGFSVNTDSVTLSDGVNMILGVVSLSSDRRTLTFTPNENLDINSEYTLSLSGVVDVAGNAIDGDVLSFTTGESIDTTRPRVSSIMPVNGAVDVSVTSDIVVTFDEV